MLATQVLRQEHEAILRMLDGLDLTNRQLFSGSPLQPSTLKGFLEFFQLFADRCHHGKEEDLLFPLLERRGIPREGGPIGVMLLEHEHGRELIRQMTSAASDYEKEPGPAGKRFAEAAEGYSALLRQHIFKENNILFQMAEQVLTPEEQTSLAADFEKVEIEKMGAGTHERLHVRMEELLADVARGRTAGS